MVIETFWGTDVQKNIGYINSEGNRVFCGYYAFYSSALGLSFIS